MSSRTGQQGVKRRTKQMERLPEEHSCYMRLAFLCMFEDGSSLEIKTLGKVPGNLPALKQLAEIKFTQKVDSTQFTIFLSNSIGFHMS